MYLAIAAGIVFVLLALNRLGMKPAKHRDLDTPGLRCLLGLLYVRGLDGAYLHIAVIASSRFVRVYKYIQRLDDVVLKAHVPKATYGALGLDQVQSALEAHGFAASMGGGPGPENSDDLVLDCGKSVSRAVVVTEFLLRDLLRLDPKHHCVAHIERGHPNPWAHPGFARPPEL